MPKAIPVVDPKNQDKVTGWAVECPACGNCHVFDLIRWKFNDNVDKPTFTPSMLVQSGHYSKFHKQGEKCWCDYNKENPDRPGFECSRCHSHLIDGVWHYLDDSTHKLKGQKVEAPDWKIS